MSDLMYLSAVQLITEACIQAENCSRRPGSSSDYIVRAFRAIQPPFIRPLMLTISQCLGVLETLVDCSMFIAVDKYLWRRTPAYGVSSTDSSASIVCQRITLDGSISRTFQPRAGVNFVLKYDETTRASLRNNFCL